MKSKKIKYRVIALICVIIAFIIVCFIFIDNKNIDYENFIVNNHNAAIKCTTQIKIAQLSDMHFPKIKINITKLLKKLDEESIDIIAITGDLIDRSANISESGVYEFIMKLKSIAPVYYVAGNHEKGHKDSNELYSRLILNDIIVLHNSSINVVIKNTNLTISGLDDGTQYDPSCFTDEQVNDNYKILLAHRPDKLSNYTSLSIEFVPNLVLSGHAHGGQIRIFNKGLIAPEQGFFPKLDNGLYEDKNAKISMVISRGIGNSIFPFRFNNKPHVPIITITI